MASAAHSSSEKKDLYDIELFVVDEKQSTKTLQEFTCSICFNIFKDCLFICLKCENCLFAMVLKLSIGLSTVLEKVSHLVVLVRYVVCS